MGDPACFLDATCFICGRFLEPADHAAGKCQCGEPIDESAGMNQTALHDRLKEDLRQAMKARDGDRVDALRMGVAALDNAGAVGIDDRGPAMPPIIGLSPDSDRRQVSSSEAERLLQTEVDQLRSAAESFRVAGRPDEAQRQDRMADVLAAYL